MKQGLPIKIINHLAINPISIESLVILKLGTARALNLISVFTTAALGARAFSSDPYASNLFAVGLLWLQILTVVMDLGMSEFLTRKFLSNNPQNDIVLEGLLTKVPIFAFCLILWWIISGFNGKTGREYILILIAILAATTRAMSDLAEAVLIARKMYTKVLLYSAGQSLILVGASFLIVNRLDWLNPETMIAISGVAYLIGTFFRCSTVRKNSLISQFSISENIKGCAPFSLITIASSLSVVAPGLMMYSKDSDTQGVDKYQGSLRIWVAILSVGQIFFTKSFNNFCELNRRIPSASFELIKHNTRLVNIVSISISLLVLLFPGGIYKLCYGKYSDEAVSCLVLFGGSIPLIMSALVPGAWLPARGYETQKAAILICSLIFNIALCYFNLNVLNAVTTSMIVVGSWGIQSVVLWVLVYLKNGVTVDQLFISLLSPFVLLTVSLLQVYERLSIFSVCSTVGAAFVFQAFVQNKLGERETNVD